MSAEEEDFGYDMVMPFLPVQSKGGPHDDAAYVAGYEMGVLDVQLAAAAVGARQSPHDPQTIHAENQEQADLIAMRHGFIAEFTDEADGWVWMKIRPAGAAVGR